MNIIKNSIIKGIFFLVLTMTLTNCAKDDSNDMEIKGNAQFEITDAPIDDTSIQGTFVTVTAVKVDGEVISNFSGSQTLDLMAYQNGDTKLLGMGELEAGTYSNVSLVLDYEKDANGNAPGCYVLTNDNTKHNLQSTSSTTGEITINSGTFEVEENSTTNIVMDFDIRKAVKKEEAPSNDDKFNFVTEAELRSSVRMVNKNKSGKVKGSANDMAGFSGDRIVVYAYKKGTFNQSTETTGQGSSNVTFKNAETSAVVDANGEFNLSFLSEGEYELHYVGYEDEDNDGEMELKGMLEVTALTSLNLLGFEVDASATVSVDVTVTGILPL